MSDNANNCKHGFNLCGICHAMDGSLWPEEESYTHIEIALTVDGKELKKTFSAEECANELVKTIKLLAADRKEIATLKAERDDWREQAQRNDTPVKSTAEIGRDAILAMLENSPSYYLDDRIVYRITDIRKYANNLTANSGDES